jgi:hypothetical protein
LRRFPASASGASVHKGWRSVGAFSGSADDLTLPKALTVERLLVGRTDMGTDEWDIAVVHPLYTLRLGYDRTPKV